MKPAILLFFILLNFTSNAQSDTLWKYRNGSYVLGKGGIAELYNKDNKSLESWTQSDWAALDGIIGRKISKIVNGKRKYGLVNDNSGELLLPILYDYINENNSEKFLFLVTNNRTGLYSAARKLIEPKYSFVYNHVNPDLIVAADDKNLFILDLQLNIIDTIKGFHMAGPGSTGFLVISNWQTEALVNYDNRVYSNKEWKSIRRIWDSTMLVSNGTKFGIYDIKTERYIKSYSFDKAILEEWNKGFLLAENNQWSYYSANGIFQTTFVADSAMLNNEKAVFFKKDGLWGLISSRGKIIQKPVWERVLRCHEFDSFIGVLGKNTPKFYNFIYSDFNSDITGIREGRIASPVDKKYCW